MMRLKRVGKIEGFLLLCYVELKENARLPSGDTEGAGTPEKAWSRHRH